MLLLDPDVMFSADASAVRLGSPTESRGADRVAGRAFVGRARGLHLALVDGEVGLAWAPGGKTRGVFMFSVVGDSIAAIALVADAERIAALDIALLGE